MPDEKPNPAKTITADEWDKVRQGVPREMQAARLIVSREIGGIPYTPYLRGDSDHAPVVRAVAGFADKVYDLLDWIDNTDAEIPPEIENAANIVARAMEQFKL